MEETVQETVEEVVQETVEGVDDDEQTLDDDEDSLQEKRDNEFKQMIKELHMENLEVALYVGAGWDVNSAFQLKSHVFLPRLKLVCIDSLPKVQHYTRDQRGWERSQMLRECVIASAAKANMLPVVTPTMEAPFWHFRNDNPNVDANKWSSEAVYFHSTVFPDDVAARPDLQAVMRECTTVYNCGYTPFITTEDWMAGLAHMPHLTRVVYEEHLQYFRKTCGINGLIAAMRASGRVLEVIFCDKTGVDWEVVGADDLEDALSPPSDSDEDDCESESDAEQTI